MSISRALNGESSRRGIVGDSWWLAGACLAVAMLSGCRESSPVESSAEPQKSPPSATAKSIPQPEAEPVKKDPTVWARYAEPGEKPRDGSSLVIEIEVPPIPPKLLAPAPPIPKNGKKR
jgi:hypothetical protein